MKFPNLDNPWLLKYLPLWLTGIGAAAGLVLGPLLMQIFTVPYTDRSDIYVMHHPMYYFYGLLGGAALGFLISAATLMRLIAQADAEAKQEADAHGH